MPKMVLLDDLVLDMKFYPRNQVDQYHVSALLGHRKAGAEFPPIIVDKNTMRVADGFHRTMAERKFQKGANKPKIKAELVEYESDADFFIASMKYNNSHGKRLSGVDYAHCLVIGERIGLVPDLIVTALQIMPQKMERLEKRRIIRNDEGGVEAILKPGISVKSKTVNKHQLSAIRYASGDVRRHARELIQLIETKTLDIAAVHEDLARLRELLNGMELEVAN